MIATDNTATQKPPRQNRASQNTDPDTLKIEIATYENSGRQKQRWQKPRRTKVARSINRVSQKQRQAITATHKNADQNLDRQSTATDKNSDPQKQRQSKTVDGTFFTCS